MQFTVLLLLLSSAICLADISEITLNSTNSNTTSPPKPKPKPPPKPSPFPPPENGDTATVAMAVREAKVYSLGSTVYERFGHALAVYGSSVVVGNARESLYSSVGLFSVQTVKVYGEGDEDDEEEKEEEDKEEEDGDKEEDRDEEEEPDEGAEEQGEEDEDEEGEPEEGEPEEDEPEDGEPEDGGADAEVSLAVSALVNVTWSQLQAVTLSSEDEDDDNDNDDDEFYSGFGKAVSLSATALAVGAPYYSSPTAGYAAGAVYVFQCQQQQANEEGDEGEEGEGEDEREEEERDEEERDEDEEDVEGEAKANEEEDEDKEGEEEDREGEEDEKEGEEGDREDEEDREGDDDAEGAIIMATGQYQMLVANESEPAYNTRFGSAVSLLSNTLAVGAPGANTKGRNAGAVYLYTYDEDDEEWKEEETLQDDNAGAAYAQFGTSVCLANGATLLAVGASGYSANDMHAGAVFIYNKVSKYVPGNETAEEEEEDATESEYMWMVQDMLAPSSLSAYSYFGHTIAFRDTIGLVSAFDEDGSGMVYLYHQQQASTATQTPSSTGSVFRGVGPVTALASLSYTLYTVLRPAVSSPADSFGASLVIFHTRDVSNAYKASGQGQVQLVNAYAVAVGAPGAYTGTSSSNTHAGAVYVYLGPHNLTAASGTTTVYTSKWSLMTTSFANDSTAYNAYGSSLALMGAHLLVGAELASTEVASRSGAVYVEANLIPYLVAVTQHNEADEGDVEEEEPEAESAFSAKSFWAFFSTSGGIVTMSFLPIALIAVFFVAHTKSKGQRVLPQHLQCSDDSFNNSKEEGSSFVTMKRSQDPEAQVPIAGTSNPLVTASNPTAATVTTSVESSVSELATEKTPSGWERFLHFLRFPGDTTAHTPLAGSDEQDQQSAEARAADLRLKAPSNAPGEPSEMSIRSPITHIPYHTSLVQSPPGSKAETATAAGVQSYRYRTMSETPARENENLLGKEGAVSAEDIQRLKQQLNSEFQGPAVRPSAAEKGNGKAAKPTIRV